MSSRLNTYVDDVAFKKALTEYNNKIKDTYADIPQANSNVDTRYLVGTSSSSGTGDANSSLYKSSSLKYSETNKKLEVPNLLASGKISTASADITSTVTVGATSGKTTITPAEVKVGNESGTTITPTKVTTGEASIGSANITGSLSAGSASETGAISAGSISASSASITSGDKTTTIGHDKVTTDMVEANSITIGGTRGISVIGAEDTSTEIEEFK